MCFRQKRSKILGHYEQMRVFPVPLGKHLSQEVRDLQAADHVLHMQGMSDS